jgi:hypothetical protein
MADGLVRRAGAVAIALTTTAVWSACGGGGGTSPAPTSGVTATTSATATPATSASSSTGNAILAAYEKAAWGSAASVVFSGCTMTFHSTGVPPSHNAYYLAPVSTQYPTAVATTPVSHTSMSLVPYMASSITSETVQINACPTKAATTTSTNMGPIGFMLSGEAIFNAYEGNGAATPALSDNVSYSFTDSSGTAQTASFIDSCSQHPTPLSGGYTWHHHGIPTCLVAQIDGTSGPSHLIGFALDGFPIYGGRDINGAVIQTSQLDACNGITSPTPEFPNGVYHYVLPIGVTNGQSSLNCYAGTVSQSTQTAMAKRFCSMGGAQPQAVALAGRRERRMSRAL